MRKTKEVMPSSGSTRKNRGSKGTPGRNNAKNSEDRQNGQGTPGRRSPDERQEEIDERNRQRALHQENALLQENLRAAMETVEEMRRQMEELRTRVRPA